MIPTIGPVEASITELALHLLRNVSQLRQHPDADTAVREITRAAARAQRAIDRPPDLAYLGTCATCGHAIYATPHAAWVACACGAEYEVAARRTQLLIQAQDILGTAAEISRALTSLGRPVTPAVIRSLAFRGRITSRGVNELRRPLYRVGDVLDVTTGNLTSAARS